jgi:septum formation protein
MSKQLILASQSPRRKELLEQLGVEFSCVSPQIDESQLPDENPYDYVLRLAIDKAKAGAQQVLTNDWVLGSDTAVVIDQVILGKPKDYEHCKAMLMQLSNKSHQVYTSLALVNGDKLLTAVIVTEVDFAQLTEHDILGYWQTGEPQDKAGSYGIQGIGGKFVKSIKGSFSAVVGLPLYETQQLLREAELIQ